MLEPDPKKGYEVPTLEELVDDAFVFLAAGSDTTAYTLSVATFHILQNKEVLARLRAELKEASRDTRGMFIGRDLANLPYLVCPSTHEAFSFANDRMTI
jgi:cytochrome P450